MIYDIKKIQSDIKEGKYENIGNGTGRSVYDIGDGVVTKYARNIKGVAQNYAEYDIYKKSRSSIFADIFTISSDCSILLMQKAEPLEDIGELYQRFKVKNRDELAYTDVIRYLSFKYGLITADLCEPGSWGEMDKKLVLIDYGYTKWVSRKFYKRQ